MATCTSFYWERLENDVQLRWLDPLSTQDGLYLWTNFESQNTLYLGTEGVDGFDFSKLIVFIMYT